MTESLTKRLDTLRQSHLQMAEKHVAELESLEGEANAVAADCRHLLSPVRKILQSLQSLDGRSGRSSGCTSKEEVMRILEELLASNGAVPKADLQGLVGERLRELGRNHKMFANIFTKALADDRFQVSPEGECRLADGRDAVDQQQAPHSP